MRTQEDGVSGLVVVDDRATNPRSAIHIFFGKPTVFQLNETKGFAVWSTGKCSFGL